MVEYTQRNNDDESDPNAFSMYIRVIEPPSESLPFVLSPPTSAPLPPCITSTSVSTPLSPVKMQS